MKSYLKLFLAVLLSVVVVFSGKLWAEELPPLPKGPLLLTSATEEMQSANFWIAQLPNPDKILKTPEQLKFFNKEILSMAPARVDIFSWPLTRRGSDIKDQLSLEYTTLANRKLFGVDDQYVKKDFFTNTVKPLMQTEQVPSQIKLKWGVAVRAASIRALPITVKMLEDKGDVEFDQLQFTQIKIWTPVAIFHSAKDGAWLYVQAPYSRGWVKAKDIAVFADREALAQMVKRDSKFVVVTGESAPVCLTSPCTSAAAYRWPSMGTVFPLVSKTENSFVVKVPVRSKDGTVQLKNGYISRERDVREGFPSFTQRNILKQAFKLLGARYGWGGQYNGRDCSGFTHDVFLSMGVDMPRDSKDQAIIGTQLGHFEPFEDDPGRVQILTKATPAITLLKMPMHMMLYIGQFNGKFYVIHSTWAERISMTSDEKNRINQVVVSDLSLNGSSRIGSLFIRVVSMNEIN